MKRRAGAQQGQRQRQMPQITRGLQQRFGHGPRQFVQAHGQHDGGNQRIGGDFARRVGQLLPPGSLLGAAERQNRQNIQFDGDDAHIYRAVRQAVAAISILHERQADNPQIAAENALHEHAFVGRLRNIEMGKRFRQRIQQKRGQQPGQHQPALRGKMHRLADDIGQQQHGQAPLKHHLRGFLAKCFIDLARAAQPSAQAQQ